MKIKLLILLSTLFVFSISSSGKISAQDLNLTSSGDIPPGIYDDVNISGSSVATLTGNVIVRGTLTFADASVINTGSFRISFAHTSSNPIESNAKGYIIGTAVMQERAISGGSFEFLGIRMAPGVDLGNVTITRVTGSNGRVILGSSSGINCKWNISSTIVHRIEREISFLWLESLGNGKNPSLSTIWKFDGNNWNQVGNPSYSAQGDPYVTGPLVSNPVSEWTISDVSSPLPIELDEFIASTIKNEVILDWVTGHELNNSHFVIERVRLSSGGEYQGDFGEVAMMQGAGTTNNITRYKYIDRNLESGKYLYRLNQVDYNGNNQYFWLSTEIIVGIPNKFALSQNYPNPFNPVTKISYEIPENLNVSMKIYDLTGREVADLINGNKTAGYHTVEFNGTNLSSGIYFIRLIAGNYSSIKKISLIK
jgi:hypothetical protein